ncbi:MAG: Asp-tRNA(Asn)/Glu-tRNA(Gln) amidotransferase subunit GatC [Leptospiraceae bacterium]|jgi:aspartyl-tRNA(Asn)/glutamyl-tRNA(Gln) amidotransferase subunit C|nr:Asp-tRNA(Asn)/Glu-tRNA(Gln) amidotransferase subunit GatC [Leptospiraceae bacterium]MBK9502408.1 Asp-tRNA(Asn)/Glu-tRNA(Gln) amidotransferase subunit GatC [Leptospiraceae bacterium]MBL0266671.1 Asp-tRNA(Asn)/Glu-tRNA(Gln) amidotransferase subunit GatC [Leptospiraceae bacterium]MBP9165659.1 Asp-tRNA(Asn)/Glu-tRNA(Gln) amidotransferase subunit GatC [Leptospiraceae bacterium]HRG47447.1 Asp-tRNA(Asn)/Glu-tRNA(Gln) amidotransferase subunit GatC [Leptospiraceae bacterium]
MEKDKLQSIANLAKLRFEESQLEGMLTDFNKIMAYVDKVKELDTNGVTEEEIYEWSENRVRPDILGNSMTRDEISRIAPKFENGYIVVPRVIET